jgi:hypothetical protein
LENKFKTKLIKEIKEMFHRVMGIDYNKYYCSYKIIKEGD